MISHPYKLLDVFTDQPLSGNQLAVFPDGAAFDERLLRPMARELNLSETVFVFPPRAGGTARVRIFTGWCELPFAGHPVLGTACVLADASPGGSGAKTVLLETGNGVVRAGPLAVHLLRHGIIRSGQEITISQGEKVGRPSTILATATAEGNEVRLVRVGGACRSAGEGTMFLPG